MKKYILIIITLALIKQASGQIKVDTIFVNLKQTTYVVCKDSIDWFEVGSKEYAGKIMGSTFFLKPLRSGTATTSLLIKSGENHIYKTVVYSDNLSKTLYDLRQSDKLDLKHSSSLKKDQNETLSADQEQLTDDTKPKRPNIEVYENALQKFLEIADPFKSIATSKERIVLSLGNAKAQGNDVYIKYNVSNYSGHRFNIDQYDLIFINQSGHLLGSDTAFDTGLEPIVKQVAKFIDPSQRGIIGFVIPLEQLNTKGKIFLRLKENPGKKLITLEIPTTIFQKN